MINKDKIFELFNSAEDDEYSSNSIHLDFMDDPFVKIGMFTKIIKNNKIFLFKLKKFFSEVGKEYNEEFTQNASSFAVYNRAWNYIKDIDLEDNNHLNALIKSDLPTLIETLEMAISYFVSTEEYEKCAHLLKIQKLAKKI